MKYLLKTIFLVIIIPSINTPILGQSLNFITGYSYSLANFDQLNEALSLSNEFYDRDQREFNEVKDMHGTMFGVRKNTSWGFAALMWEQKLRSSKGVLINDNNREVTERWSFSWTSLTFETALTAGPISAGVGIQGNKFTTKLEASFVPKRVKLLDYLSFGNYFFLELALGKPNNIQIALRPFYQMAWKDLDYKNLNYLIGGLSPNHQESKHFWGLALILRNGPKNY